MINSTFVAGLLSATVSVATPLLLATLGEIISQRGGVLNLGIEGMMSVGAFVGFAVTVLTGSPLIGFIAGGLAGGILSIAHAFLTITLKSDQVISGLMLTLLGTSIATYFGGPWTKYNIDGFSDISLPVLSHIPILGESFFTNPLTDYFAIALVPAVWYFLFRTNLGLEIIATGEDPSTADTRGINVARRRYIAVIIGGCLAGAGGADLSLAVSNLWAPGIVSGRGWIAIALVIFARWDPIQAIFGAYIFGLVESFRIRSQELDIASAASEVGLEEVANFLLAPSIMRTYPFVITIILLTVISRKLSKEGRTPAPSAMLQPYLRGSD
jgi:simple sugar transport system permease protein